MATEVVIPKMGMTMQDGTLVEWLVPDGGRVSVGQPLFHMVTEKLDCDVEAEGEGVLRHVVGPDTTLQPGGIVGFLLADGEAMPAFTAPVASGGGAAATEPTTASGPVGGTAPAASATNGRLVASPNARRVAKQHGVDLTLLRGTGPNGRITSEDVEAALANPPVASPAPVPAVVAAAAGAAPAPAASPIARKLAERLGVDLTGVAGTGPGGRIQRSDVEGAVRDGTGAETRTAAARAVPAAPGPRAGDRIRLQGMRGTIARRMHESISQMAQLTIGMEVDLTRAVALREQLRDDWADDDERRLPTYTDLVVKAAALALRAHPLLNAEVGPDAVELLGPIHVGLAVALDTGLVVPVIRHTDEQSLADIAIESARLAEAARAGTLGLDDLTGGTFSVTTLGGAGVDFFTPIINPPNVAILGVGRIKDAVVWEGDTPARSKAMTLSLTFDHRAVDGTPAAAFLGTVKTLLEAPLRLLA